jgi:lysozyme
MEGDLLMGIFDFLCPTNNTKPNTQPVVVNTVPVFNNDPPIVIHVPVTTTNTQPKPVVPDVTDDLSKSGIDLIKTFEGCSLEAYADPLTGGLPVTIGWGSTRDENEKPFSFGQVITQARADALLEHECREDILPELRKIPYWNDMNDGQRGALLSFAYNLGPNFYGNSRFRTITNCLKTKDWDGVPDALFLYRNPGTNVEKGLARRRRAEGALWKGSSA